MKTGTINDEPFSVPDGYSVISNDELSRLRKWATLVADLDRNANGRHASDVDSGELEGVSLGNPLLPRGCHLGWTMGGRRIIVPTRETRHDPDAWIE